MINEERMKIVEIEYKRAIRMGQYQTVRMLNDNVYNEYFKEYLLVRRKKRDTSELERQLRRCCDVAEVIAWKIPIQNNDKEEA